MPPGSFPPAEPAAVSEGDDAAEAEQDDRVGSGTAVIAPKTPSMLSAPAVKKRVFAGPPLPAPLPKARAQRPLSPIRLAQGSVRKPWKAPVIGS